METNLILILHIIVCVVLVILVLLQSGREGMGVIFGGGSGSVFGGTGAGGILVKLTSFVAILFVVSCLTYNIVTTTSATQESIILNMPVDDPSAPAPADIPEASVADPAASAPQPEAVEAPAE